MYALFHWSPQRFAFVPQTQCQSVKKEQERSPIHWYCLVETVCMHVSTDTKRHMKQPLFLPAWLADDSSASESASESDAGCLVFVFAAKPFVTGTELDYRLIKSSTWVQRRPLTIFQCQTSKIDTDVGVKIRNASDSLRQRLQKLLHLLFISWTSWSYLTNKVCNSK